MQGMSAVLWVEPVRTNPPNPRRMYVNAKIKVMDVIRPFYLGVGLSKVKFRDFVVE
jgi:hypothetical protein